MTEAGPPRSGGHQITIQDAKERLSENGGYEIVHQSPGLELGVYVLVAPEPDRQQPHDDDEVYVVLEGRGTLDVEGERYDLTEGDSVFVPAGAEHQFVGYEQLSVLVIFEKRPK
jgi:mannose-6-phosphate isomerase-like protein (cupin superfamily)